MNKVFRFVAAMSMVACGSEADYEVDEADFGSVEQAVNVPLGSPSGSQTNRTVYGGKSGPNRLTQNRLPAYLVGTTAIVVPSTKAIKIGINISDSAGEKIAAQSSMQGACNALKNLLSGWSCTVTDREGTGCASSDTVCVTLGPAGSQAFTSNSDMRKWVSVQATSCTTQTATEFPPDREVKVCGLYHVQLNFNGINARTDTTTVQETTLKVYAARHGLVQGPFGIGTVSAGTDFQTNGHSVSNSSLVSPIPPAFLQPEDKCLANQYNPLLGQAASLFVATCP